jgi:hypothetical protein
MKHKNILLSLTAAAMIVVPVTAQAGTTASAATGKISTLSGVGQRKSATVAPKQKLEGALLALVLVGGAGAAAGVAAVASGGDNASNGS